MAHTTGYLPFLYTQRCIYISFNQVGLNTCISAFLWCIFIDMMNYLSFQVMSSEKARNLLRLAENDRGGLRTTERSREARRPHREAQRGQRWPQRGLHFMENICKYFLQMLLIAINFYLSIYLSIYYPSIYYF